MEFHATLMISQLLKAFIAGQMMAIIAHKMASLNVTHQRGYVQQQKEFFV